jgi:hypothetical protein
MSKKNLVFDSYGAIYDSNPIWVSGVYRSGTTFISALIGAHPDIQASSSTIKFLRFCLGKYGDLNVEENLKTLLFDTNKRIEVRWNLSINIHNIIDIANRNSKVSYALVYDLIMRDMLDCNRGEHRWLEKLAVQWLDIPTFLEMFPNGRVVHAVRDPRDVMASYKHMTIEKGNTYIDAAFNCRSSMEFVSNLEKKYSERVKIVKVEDISKGSEYFIKDLCEFLSLDYSEDIFKVKNLSSAGEEWSTNTSYGKKYNSLPNSKPRWPKKLSREEVILTELITQPYFSNFEYKSSGYSPTKKEWNSMYSLLNDKHLKSRFDKLLFEGKGSQGYRSDPILREMEIVFPERFS